MARASRTGLFLLLAVVLAGGCRGSSRGDAPPPPADAAIARGGELVASLRSEPGNYNRYFEALAAADLVSHLTQDRLVRVDRATDELQPSLAESWTTADGIVYTLKLRPGLRFSDGAPFTSADVVFSFRAAYEAPGSVIGSGLRVGGKPLTVTAVDPLTVTIAFPQAFAPALRLLDNLAILPKHKLQAAFDAKTMREAWTPSKPLADIAGLGPFVLSEHVAGQRLSFARNPHYWRRAPDGAPLPYLDRLTLVIVPDQNAEAVRLESGAIDLMANADIRPDDYARFRQLRDRGVLQLIDGGIGLDPNVLWFNLKPGAAATKAWLRRREFRQALSFAADRQAIADTVYLGAAVPIYGPITPRNATWFSASVPVYAHDPAKARQLLASIGLRDANGDGLLEDGTGRPVRFSMLVQQGHVIRERTASALQAQFKAVGVGVDVVALDGGAIFQRWLKSDYDSVFHGFQVSVNDPAMTPDFWVSSSPQHFWNPSQPEPATPWERRMDELMAQQAASSSLEERQRLFAEVQRILGEELPALHFVAPKVTIAASTRVRNLQPAPQIPQLLWAADRLAVAPRAGGGR